MAKKTFTFDNKSSADFGLFINGRGVFDSPEPDLEYVSIPGRSGDLIYDNNRFHNIEVTYPACFMLNGFRENFKALQAFLLSHKGYFRLEDDYLPDHFRMASVQKPISLSDIDWVYDAGSCDLEFNCKPQLYLKSGDVFYNHTQVEFYKNPTNFQAMPLFKAVGYGNFTIQYIGNSDYNTSVVIEENNLEYIMIDCELMDCYGPNGENANQYVSFSGHKPITLLPGNHAMTISGTMMLTVKPRWWTV